MLPGGSISGLRAPPSAPRTCTLASGPAQRRPPQQRPKKQSSPPRAGNGSVAEERESWGALTDKLVSMSSVPFSVLVLPQAMQNFVNMSSGNTAALSIISWEGYTSALLGNTLMCSHFANQGERTAVNVQLIGIANNMLVLTQLALASIMPSPVYALAAVLVGVAVVLCLARLAGKLPASSSQPSQLGIWRSWQLVSGLVGLSVVPQVLYNVLVPTHPSFLPGLATLVLLALVFAFKSDREKSIQSLPGWGATLLFALSPLPQLVRNFLDASSLQGLSVGTMLLALLGNVLMVARALYVRDVVWLAGTTWACIAGWGQLLSMFIRESPLTGLRYVHPAVFGAVTVLLFGYLAFVANKDAKVKGHSSPLQSLGQTLKGAT